MKKIFVILAALLFLTTSCESLEHWLFNASDYHLVKHKADTDETLDEQDLYWDGADYDIWYDEYEYD